MLRVPRQALKDRPARRSRVRERPCGRRVTRRGLGPTQSLFHSGVHSASVALTRGFDKAFLVGAGFAVAGAILAIVLISSRDSRKHPVTARSGDPAPAAAAG